MKHIFCGLFILVVVSCMREAMPVQDVTITLSAGDVLTRSSDPDETIITDYNLYIFNSLGFLEYGVYKPSRELSGGSTTCTARLLTDAPYIVFAAANLGYELRLGSIQQAREYRYHMAYPDEFSQGMPMSAYMGAAVVGKDAILDIHLERVMSRVDLSVDRRSLDDDVSIRITSVQMCNTASSVLLFSDSYVENWSQLFNEGYSKAGTQLYWLNHDTMEGISGEVPFYILENRFGGITESYIEVKADYHSASCHTKPGESLIFRFYLNDDRDACRNVRYRITLQPKGTGLECTDGWRLDKSALVY